MVHSAADREELLRVARVAIVEYLEDGRRPRPRSDAPALRATGAAFVTLWRRDTEELRGCRGEVRAHQPLIDSVAHMAVASAVDDPRFPPVRPHEVPSLRIEINALTPLAPIDPADIVIGRHGLMIVAERRSGLLLPEVAERAGWTVQEFLSGTCQKAGLPDDAWRRPDITLYGFEAEAWHE